MKKEKSLTINFIYNFLYTGLNLLFPIIVSPYISRVLGADNSGKVDFANTIVNWFLIFAVFGSTTYGIREIARVRDEKDELNRVFTELFTINCITTGITIIVYFLAIVSVKKFQEEALLFLALSFTLILNIFTLDWFYQGIEEYRYITVRSFLFKILALIATFVFVKKRDDYIIYGIIGVLATSLSGILNYLYSKRFVRLSFKGLNIKRHFKGLSIFFVTSFITNIYLTIDKVILGFAIDDKSVAFISKSRSVINMAVAVSTAVSHVALPRASYYIHKQKETYINFVKRVPNYILWFSMPLALGCIFLAPNIMYILGGKEFLPASMPLAIMAVTIILIPLSTFYQEQILVVSGKESWGAYCSFISSAISLILNVMLIPLCGVIGAAITYVMAEAISCIIKAYLTHKKLLYNDVRVLTGSSIYYLAATIIMGLIVLAVKAAVSNVVIAFLVSAIAGAVSYGGVLLALKEKVTTDAFRRVREKLLKIR